MSAEYPIPPEMHSAFLMAIDAFDTWNHGLPEPLISLGQQPYSIEGICTLTRIFTDLARDGTYEAVSYRAEQFGNGTEGLNHDCSGPKDHTYQSVADCLSRLVIARRDYYERLSKSE